MTSQLTRRAALKTAALATFGLPSLAASLARAAEASAAPAAPPRRPLPLRLGVASFTFAKLPVEGVIAALQRLELNAVALYKTHAPWADGTPEQCRAVVRQFADAGITVTSTGMIEITNDEAAARRALDNVRAAGLKLFCAHLKADALPLLDRLVKEYDLKAAIHNHGPTEDLPTGLSVWHAIQPFDPRVGLCLDIAHGFRAGENPADTVRRARARLYQVHLRDTMAPGGTMKDPNPTVIGHGAIDVRGVIAALLEIKYPFQAEFEYEKKEDDRVPGLAESVGYVRGLIAGLTI